MKELKVIMSVYEPSAKDCLWLKPVAGGFVLYKLMDGAWQPLKIVDDNSTKTTLDDTVQKSVSAAKTEIIAAIQGKNTDTADDLTLNGVKAYVDAALAAVE